MGCHWLRQCYFPTRCPSSTGEASGTQPQNKNGHSTRNASNHSVHQRAPESHCDCIKMTTAKAWHKSNVGQAVGPAPTLSILTKIVVPNRVCDLVSAALEIPVPTTDRSGNMDRAMRTAPWLDARQLTAHRHMSHSHSPSIVRI